MSRIGKQPVTLPNGVTVTLSDAVLTVQGPKGVLHQKIDSRIRLETLEDQAFVTTTNISDAQERAQWGLARSLLNNMVHGVSVGFRKSLEIQGVGYRSEIQGNKLILSVGFSHKVTQELPNDVMVELDPEIKNVLHVSGIDKQRVGEVAAKIREVRKPEPYKGKGIRYVGEYVRRKAGKTGAS